jgi:hypothetical protein
MNHAVVSVVNGEPAKVRCRTCHSDHDYRHEQAPPPKVDLRKAALFNEVLKKVSPTDAPVAVDGDAVEVELPDLEEAPEVESEGGIEAQAMEAEAAAMPRPAPKAKAAKPKLRKK